MRDHYDHSFIILQHLCQFKLHAIFQEPVECRKGFIQQDNIRTVGHYACERNALLLTSGNLAWEPILETGQFEFFYHLIGSAALLFLEHFAAGKETAISWFIFFQGAFAASLRLQPG